MVSSVIDPSTCAFATCTEGSFCFKHYTILWGIEMRRELHSRSHSVWLDSEEEVSRPRTWYKWEHRIQLAHLLGLPSQNTTDWVLSAIEAIEVCFFAVLEARSPWSRGGQVWLLPRPLSLACGWPPSRRVRTGSCVCAPLLSPHVSEALFLWGHPSHWIRAHPTGHILP